MTENQRNEYEHYIMYDVDRAMDMMMSAIEKLEEGGYKRQAKSLYTIQENC